MTLSRDAALGISISFNIRRRSRRRIRWWTSCPLFFGLPDLVPAAEPPALLASTFLVSALTSGTRAPARFVLVFPSGTSFRWWTSCPLFFGHPGLVGVWRRGR